VRSRFSRIRMIRLWRGPGKRSREPVRLQRRTFLATAATSVALIARATTVAQSAEIGPDASQIRRDGTEGASDERRRILQGAPRTHA
jgi:hypothetical protein